MSVPSPASTGSTSTSKGVRALIEKWRKNADEPWDAGYVNTWLGCAFELEQALSSEGDKREAQKEEG